VPETPQEIFKGNGSSAVHRIAPQRAMAITAQGHTDEGYFCRFKETAAGLDGPSVGGSAPLGSEVEESDIGCEKARLVI
jgi:hypothetical protein